MSGASSCDRADSRITATRAPGSSPRIEPRTSSERFAVAGHDRGAPVAFRAAMDHPGRIVALTTVGRAVPIVEALARIDVSFAREWRYWFFLGQTGKPAEKVIAAIGPSPQTTPTAPRRRSALTLPR